MTEQLIDLTQSSFWLVLLFAALAVSPLTQTIPKQNVWALVNCGFLFTILQWYGVVMILIVYLAYLILQGVAGNYRKFFIVIALIVLTGLFLVHKSPFFSEILELSPLRMILSMTGFSYLMLRMIEVLRAVFEKKSPPPNIVLTVNYLIPFHMLAAGPIQSYEEFISEPVEIPPPSSERALGSIERIVLGLFKKFVLAYLIHEIFLTDFQSNGFYFFIEVQLFFFWLYLDFSAYSDIAFGIGQLLGIPTPENFNKPYLARNVIDFWERWHISLSQFIRRNIFIPLQLSLSRRNAGTRPLLTASIAFVVAFLICGLWHGISINFLLWGLVHAIGLIVANLYKVILQRKLKTHGVKKYLKSKPILYLARLITYEFVAFSLVLLFYP